MLLPDQSIPLNTVTYKTPPTIIEDAIYAIAIFLIICSSTNAPNKNPIVNIKADILIGTNSEEAI